MTERIWPIFISHPVAKEITGGSPLLSGHTVDGGLHRPDPPPKFNVEFVVMDTGKTDPVDVVIKTLEGDECGSGTVSPQQPLKLKLLAGAYVREVHSREAEFCVDKPERFDVLSWKSELL
jgi:hypothetical protein